MAAGLIPDGISRITLLLISGHQHVAHTLRVTRNAVVMRLNGMKLHGVRWRDAAGQHTIS
jgi:hypothetical protein